MRRNLCLILALVFAFSGIVTETVLADDISLYYNNTLATNTIFNISDAGVARVTLNYEGYPNITTGATITIKIEKRNLLFFWSDIVEDVITVSGDSYYESHSYQLDNTGTYRCTVKYVISGSGGSSDTINFEDTQTYE